MTKSRYWVALMYPENMISDWKDRIAELVQIPFAYCVHDKDLEKDGNTVRKEHVHVILAFSNTTTDNHALTVFKTLEKPGCQAIPNDAIQQVFSVRNQYNYLIHDTEDCKKKKKHLYDKAERIVGNGFDIGVYEQVSATEKLAMKKELAELIFDMGFTNYMDFYWHVVRNYDDTYFDLISTSTHFFESLTRGNYQKMQHQKQ